MNFRKKFNLIIRFVTSNQRKIRFEVHFNELWSMYCRLSTIIRSNSNNILATVMIADNQKIQIQFKELHVFDKKGEPSIFFYRKNYP